MKTALAICALLVGSSAEAAAYEVGIPPGGEPSRSLHATLDATFTYGIGAYSALGMQLHALGQLSLWNTNRATGSFDFGVVVGVQDEPQALQYGIPQGLSNDAQRLNLWSTAGHTFHLGQRRRVGLGFHLFAGWTHVFSQATVIDPKHNLNTRLSDNYGLFNTGGMLKFDYRFSKYVGLSLQAVGPWPISASYVTTLFHVGVGLTGYLK